MISLRQEIDRLRTILLSRGASPQEADSTCDLAAQEIDQALLEIVSQAVQQAAQIGIELGAHEFIADLGVREVGGSFSLMTQSGRTDFSLPPLPMLPRLLKNAKTAADGSRYKVIPVEGKSTTPKSTAKDLFSVIRSINEKADAARTSTAKSDPSSMPATKAFSSGFSTGYRPPERQDHKTIGGTPNFRVASSKQNPNEKWVLPPKELNMLGTIMDINTQMQTSIEQSVFQIIKRHGG